jgi:hypothetical protein
MKKNEKTKNLAISFLCKDLQPETYNFGEKIRTQLGLPVYYVIDSCMIPDFVTVEALPYMVVISDSTCVEAGFQNCMVTGQKVNTVLSKNPISYDKMLFYFCRRELSIDFLFVFEDDVFIPSVETVANLMGGASDFDLVTPNNFYKDDEVYDWHWNNVLDKIDPPYYFSMVSAFGLSRNLLNVIDEYVKKNNTLFFTEVMFNTLAMQNNLSVTDAFELKSVVWQGEWGINEFLLLPDNVFHPKKDLGNFEEYRADILRLKDSRIPIENNLPPFIKELM